MTDLIDEINQDMKEERKILTFMKILPYIIAIAVVIISIISIDTWLDYRKEKKNKKYADLFYQANEQIIAGNNSLAKENLEFLAENGKTKISELAKLKKAELNLNNQNYQEFWQIASDDNNHIITRQIAALNWFQYYSQHKLPNYASLEDAQAMLNDFSEADQPLASSFLLMKALFTQKHISKKEAILQFNEIALREDVLPQIKEYAKLINSN